MSDIEIEVNGRGLTLRPTAAAVKVACSYGGLRGAFDRLQALDFDAYVQIIAAASGKKPRDIEDDVLKSPWIEFVEPLSDLLSRLGNGGKPIVRNEDGEAPKGEA